MSSIRMTKLYYNNVLDLDDRFWEKVDEFSKILIVILWGYSSDDATMDPYDVTDVYKVLFTSGTQKKEFPHYVEFEQSFDCVIEYEGKRYNDIAYGNFNWAERRGSGIAIEPELYEKVDPLLTEIREKHPEKDIHLSSINEEIVMQLAMLREKHGLPGMTSKTAEIFVSKVAFANKLKEIGFMGPQGVFVDLSEHYNHDNSNTDVRSILNVTDFPDFPIVFKPIASTACKGLAKIYSKNDMSKFLEKLNGHEFRKYVVQENLETWTLFAVCLLVAQRGRVITTGICETVYDWADQAIKKQAAGYIFLNQENLVSKALIPIVTEMFAKLHENKTCGAYFVEFFVNPTDLANPAAKITKNSVRFLEMAARPMLGPHMSRVIAQRCGIFQVPLHLLGPFMPKEITINTNPKFAHCGYISWLTREGILKDIMDIQLILKEMGAEVTKYYCSVKVGDAMKDATSMDLVAVDVTFVANSDEEIRTIFSYIIDLEILAVE